MTEPRRRARPSGLSAIVAACLTTACGPEPSRSAAPPAPDEAAPTAGAGAIVRIGPALDAVVPADAVIERLADGFRFTEGPVWVPGADPHLLFSDIPANTIYRWAPGSGVSAFLNPVSVSDGASVGSNGLTLDAEGRLVMMEHGDRQVSRLEADGSRTVLADRYEGRRLNSPNDGVYRSDGWLYFTDPPYGLPEGDDDPAKELDFNGVYRLGPGGELELLTREQSRPNGIALSPDESTLYVANSDETRKVWMAYDVLEDGRLGPGRVFADVTAEQAEGLPDGLKIDREGRVFATGPGGVWIFDPDGVHLGTIQPDEVPANVGWGEDGATLFMTARTGLYRVRLDTQGVMP